MRNVQFALLAALLSCEAATAAVFDTSFTLTGDNGETGSGSFRWSDDPDPGAGVTTGDGEVISLSITLSGGNVSGGSTSFSLADCSSFGANVVPAFTTSIFFSCNNGVNDTVASASNTVSLNGGASLITVSSPVTISAASSPASIPVLPTPALLLLLGLIAAFGMRVAKSPG
jgi:hypothetical protein